MVLSAVEGLNFETFPKEMEANPINVVLDSEDSFSKKYFVPMFLRAKQRFEPTAKMMPTTDAEALEIGSDPIAEIKTVIMMKTTSELIVILPMEAKMKEVKRGSHILIMCVREAEVTPRLLLVIKTLERYILRQRKRESQ